jgi:hypothetical protein
MNPEVTIKIATSSEGVAIRGAPTPGAAAEALQPGMAGAGGETHAPPVPTELPGTQQAVGAEKRLPVPESIDLLGVAAARPGAPMPVEEVAAAAGAASREGPQPMAPEELEAQMGAAAVAQRGPEPVAPEQLEATAGALGAQAPTPEEEPEKKAGQRRSRSTRTKKE